MNCLLLSSIHVKDKFAIGCLQPNIWQCLLGKPNCSWYSIHERLSEYYVGVLRWGMPPHPTENIKINPRVPQMGREDLLMVDQNQCKLSSLSH
jgi:hypothetical protein